MHMLTFYSRTQEELQGRAMKQDMEIMSLLQRIDKLTTDRRIRDWLSQAQPQDSSSSRDSDGQFMQYDDRRSSVHTGLFRLLVIFADIGIGYG